MAGNGDSSKTSAIPDIRINKPEISEGDRETAELLKDKANTFFKGKSQNLFHQLEFRKEFWSPAEDSKV